MSDASPKSSLSYERSAVRSARADAGSSFGGVMRVLAGLELVALLAALAATSMVVARWLRPADDAETEGRISWTWVWIALGAAAAFALLVAIRAVLTGDANIILKQMRQRALGTWLTLLSVLLGVALAIAVLLVNRESGRLFGQTDFGYELVIGPPKGSKLTLVLNTVYHMEQSEGVIPYSLYEEMSTPGTDYGKQVRAAVPFMVGDSYKGRRIVGTSPRMIGYDDAGKRMENPWQYRRDKSYELAQGKSFHPQRFEAVIGSEVARELGMNVYDANLSEAENEKRNALFQATHGLPAPGETEDIHDPKWKIVGILKPTGTANDKVLFVPVISLYAIAEHSSGMIMQAFQRKSIDPTRLSADELREALRKLGFDPEKLPPSVLRKFKQLRTPGNTPATAPATKPDKHDDHDHDHEKPATGASTSPATKPAGKHDDHDHDHDHEKPARGPSTSKPAGKHDDHDHDHDREKPAKPATGPSTSPATRAAGKHDHDHDHDHDHEGAPAKGVAKKKDDHDHDHDHGKPATGPATVPSTFGATKPAGKHDDHDHDHEKPATGPSATKPAGKHDDHDHDHDHEKPATAPATAPALSAGIATKPVAKKDDHDHDHGGELLQGPGAKKKDDHDDHHDHAHEEAYHLDEQGNIVVDLPRDEWALSAILVKTRAPFMTESLLYHFKVINTDAQAASPARVMRDFFDTFLKGTTYVLLALAALVSVVAAVSILVSIYNSVAARQKEIAVLRALGATRGKVLSLICLEAGAIGLFGGLLGFIAGHALGALGSAMFSKVIGEGINWWVVDRYEVVYLAGVVLVAVIAGLVPALKAYRVPVVTNLTAG